MDQDHFNAMLDEIFATFGRLRPADASPVYKHLKRKIVDEAQVPNEAARFLADAISEFESMPTNMGMAILDKYSQWRSKHPLKKEIRQPCPLCDKRLVRDGLVGFLYVKDATGKEYLQACPCNPNNHLGLQIADDAFLTRHKLSYVKVS